MLDAIRSKYDERSRRLVRYYPFWLQFRCWAWLRAGASWSEEELALPLKDRRVPFWFWPSCIVQLSAIGGLIWLFADISLRR